MAERFRKVVESPIGRLVLVAERDALVAVELPSERESGTPLPTPSAGGTNPLLERAAEELAQYFRGERVRFTVPTEAAGTEFQREVWRALSTIPYGETRSYAWLARRVGRPRACRAVGGANRCNPLPIVVPCHRVVASDGSPGGYSGGIGIKRRLLELEARAAAAAGPAR